MSTNYHTPIVTGAAANAATINAPLAEIDTAITAASVELTAARSPYASLDMRLDSIVAAGGNVATLTNGAAAAAQSVVVVDSSVGFIAGARVAYATINGGLEYNTIQLINSGTQITLGANIGGGGIADNIYISMISEAEYQAANAPEHGNSATMTLPRTIERITKNTLNVLNFGAVGDGVTDDATAIQATFDAADVGDTVWFPPTPDGYAVESGVIAPPGIHIIMDGPILYTGGNNVTTLTVGSIGVNNAAVVLKLNVTRSVLSDWTNESSIAIKLLCANQCQITIICASNHTIGLQCIGDSKGFAYNNVLLGFVYDNKIQIDCTSMDTNAVGWCNENIFIGGRLGVGTSSNKAQNCYGVRITSQSSTKYYSNNNAFFATSIEMQNASRTGGAEGVPILIEYGNQNHFWGFRNESNNETLVRISNNSTENSVTTGYGSIDRSGVNDSSLYPATYIESSRNRLQETARTFFNSGPLHLAACYYDGATNIHVPRCHLYSSSNNSVNVYSNDLTLNANYLIVNATRGVGVFVDTRTIKRFVVRRDVESANPGRVAVRCYDSSGNVLNSAGANHPYVKGLSFRTPTYTSNFGGAYGTASDTAGDFFFVVHADVAYIAIICHGGTAPLYIRSFSVAALDSGNADVWVGYEQQIPGVNLGSAEPSAGTWAVGRRVYKIGPAAAGVEGWICVAAGTPGTWKTFGTISA